MRFWVLWALGLCLFTQSLTAKEIAGEWILTVDVPGNWESVVQSLRGRAKFIRALGSSHRHALFFSEQAFSKERSQWPRHILFIQPNLSYNTQESVDPNNNGPRNTVNSWGLQLNEAWKITQGSKEVRVAILDSGIDRNHEDLRQNIGILTKEVPGNGKDDDGNGWIDDDWGWNFIHQNNNPQDDKGHGSFCAGIIGADWDNDKGVQGINRLVSLLSVKILDSFGQGSTATAIEGIEYAMSTGVHIINASWGGKQFDPALFETIKRATLQGILFVAAAGNNSEDNDENSKAIYPASFNIPGLIAVAAYDDGGTRAPCSNYGRQRVHLGAPGVDLVGLQLGGYGVKSGTSFAAPQVAGIAALLKAAFFEMTPFEIQRILMRTSSPLHYSEKYYTVTGGLVNAEHAVAQFAPPTPTSPKRWKKIPFFVSSAHPYAASSSEEITIKEPGAQFLRINFKKFDVEKTFDKVVLRDSEGYKVYEYSGKLESFTSVESQGEELRLQLISDYNRQFYGFDIDSIEAAYEN